MKKLISLLLAAALTASCLASCSNSGTNTETESGGSTSDNTQVEAVEEEIEEFTLETAKAQYSRNYEGYSYRIADRASGDWMTFDVYAEEITGETINDSIYTRNSALEDVMNIKIVECPFDAVTSSVKTSITAGTDDFDLMTDGINSVATLASQNYIYDYADISTINPENSWWDYALYKDMSIYNHHYFMTGDISVMDNYGTWCYLFNKQMITDMNLDNPYDLVDTGKWTIDKHNEMAIVATIDLDGDGRWTMEDSYGYITETYNNIAMWSCFGFRICEKDDRDLPYFTYDGEVQVNALMKVIDTEFGEFTNMGTNSTVNGGGSFTANTRENQFAIGRGLFYYAGMRNITLYREAETDFGVIPAPKYNEEQERYYSSYSWGNFTCYAVPVTVADVLKVGDIMEAMAHLSVFTLTPAYYDQTLIGKATRDVESEPMIALILSTRNYDLGIIFDWGGIASGITNMQTSDSVASKFKSLSKASNKVLDKYIKSLTEPEA